MTKRELIKKIMNRVKQLNEVDEDLKVFAMDLLEEEKDFLEDLTWDLEELDDDQSRND